MCDKQHKFLKAYQRAVNTFSVALDALEASRGCIGPEEYKRMEGYVEQARLNAEQARIDLERHGAEHGCAGYTTIQSDSIKHLHSRIGRRQKSIVRPTVITLCQKVQYDKRRPKSADQHVEVSGWRRHRRSNFRRRQHADFSDRHSCDTVYLSRGDRFRLRSCAYSSLHAA